MDKKSFFITTSIAYVNAPPHIGYALESIQADILARFSRQKGKKVFFQTGVDEHGAKIVRAALKAGVEPKSFVDENAEKFRSLKGTLNLSWDVFARTTDEDRHWPGVLDFWKKMESAGDLYRKKYKGLYCVGHEAFVTEKDLIDGVCRDHKEEPKIIEEENWFFRLSKYASIIKEKIESGELKIISEAHKNEIISFIESGVEDVSFSRPRKDLKWGIPVPDDAEQTIYVWADALVNYLDYPEHWPADIHLIGKDILRFHSLIWIGMLLSVKMALPKSILVHGFITVDGEKMSKTVGNIVDPFELVKKYGIDPVRYYLLREIPSSEDGDFSYAKFEDRYNGDLANGLGNFAARVLTLAGKSLEFEGDRESLNKEAGEDVVGIIKETLKSVGAKVESFKLHEALAEIWKLIAYGDSYINQHKVWGSAPAEKKLHLVRLIVLLYSISEILSPFLPDTAVKIQQSIYWDGNKLAVKKRDNLFPRLK